MKIIQLVAKTPRLRLVNNLLTIVAAALIMYLIAMPVLPDVSWWVEHNTPFRSRTAVALPAPKADKKEDRPVNNTLVIPRLNMQQQIFEGASTATLHLGLWHRPASSIPLAGGNTVIIGHRFTYSDPAVFYHLDKVEVGDPITVYWQQQRYDYKVTSKQVVSPSDMAIERNTAKPELTLYTCTPLWTSRDRLVIVAALTGHQL